MSVRATAAALLAGLTLAGLVPADAQANRLDGAAHALREPGVWVDSELTWLLGPREARRLDRQIARAEVPVRVAVLPQVEADESRGDPRAIARAIISRAGRDGLYVLVDQDGRVRLAARNLALEIEGSLGDRGYQETTPPLAERLEEVVRTVSMAPSAAVRSFEPDSNPKGVRSSSPDGDSLVMIAFVCALLGALAGGALHLAVRGVVAVARGRQAGGRV